MSDGNLFPFVCVCFTGNFGVQKYSVQVTVLLDIKGLIISQRRTHELLA